MSNPNLGWGARRLSRAASGALVALACLLGSASARADGALLPTTALPGAAKAALVADVAQAKQRVPTSFAAVKELRSRLSELDEGKRGRAAPLTAMLKSLGPDGLFPMLSEMVLDGAPKGALADSAWQTWRVSLLEAVGSLRDPRSAPVLAAVLDSPETDEAIVKAAASALGKVGTDAAAAKLVAMSKGAGPKQSAVLAGMGDCRRTVVAARLAAVIAAKPEAVVARGVLRALGDVGSAPAWKTPVVAQSGEEAATRSAAAKALVGAFVAYDGALRKLASDALMVVDDPSTPALVAAAKKAASPSVSAALDELANRFANNPTR